MNWEEITDETEFIRITSQICEKDEARYSLLLGLVLGIKRYGSFRFLIYSDKACAFQSHPDKPLVISDLTPEQAVKLAKYIDAENSIGEIVGTKESVSLVLDQLRQKHPDYPEMLMSQNIFANSKVILPQINYKLIQASVVHQPLVKEWFKQFMIDSYIETNPCDKRMLSLAEKRIALGDVYLLIKDGNPVSMACSSRPTKNSITINGVFTPIERRGEGFASEACALLTEDLLKKYKFCSLYTDSTNPISNKIYERIGYKQVCQSLHYKLK